MAMRTKVVLAHMPLGLIQLPALGLSLLKSACRESGFDCTIRYFNFEMLERFFEPCEAAARQYVAVTTDYRLAFAVESIFSDMYFGPCDERARYFDEVMADSEPPLRMYLSRMREVAPLLIEHCLATVDWDSVGILGLGSAFIGMTLPSAVVARAVKARHPHVVTVLGGPNVEGSMGVALAGLFPEFDAILRGEADLTFPSLCERVRAGDPLDGISGIVLRDSGGRTRAWPARPVTRLDDLPVPDFDDFMRHARDGPLSGRFSARLQIPFETSRGCWWGEASHCKFCGINGEGMQFRAKSPDRALDEIERLVERYRPHTLFAADAILDRSYFSTLMPALAERDLPVSLSYEIKANLREEQVAGLAAAGIDEILPGIECFSTPLLKRMAKGSTGLDNVLCLRLAEEYRIRVRWYFMIGLPGETAADTDWNLGVAALIPHLPPPREIARFTLQRFTPYFREAAEHDIANVRPMRQYGIVFAADDAVLAALAYNFEFDFADGRSEQFTARNETRTAAALAAWESAYSDQRLDQWSGRYATAILDQRAGRRLLYVLGGAAAAIQQELARPVSVSRLMARIDELRGHCRPSILSRIVPGFAVLDDPELEAARAAADRAGGRIVEIPDPLDGLPKSAPELQAALETHLEKLVGAGLVLREGLRFLSLAVRRNQLQARESGAPVAEAVSEAAQ